MKKEYKKPEILVENFNICQNIAAGCNETSGALLQPGACPYNAGVNLFVLDVIKGCTLDPGIEECHDGSNSYGGYFYS